MSEILPPADLDHLVVAARSLDQGTAHIHRLLGVAPAGGGNHAAMGTHNRVLKLGNRCYLEVIAVDPAARPPDWPRWFHLDDPEFQARLARRPRLVAWVARTPAIDRLSEAFQPPLTVRPMRRGGFRWRFAFTGDGSLPGDGVLPHLIQWDGPNHPADGMPDSRCRLRTLDGRHPHPAAIQAVLAALGLADAMSVQAVSPARPAGLVARIHTPGGEVVLD